MISNQTVMSTSDTTVSNVISTDINQETLSTSLCEKRDKPYFLPHTDDISKFYVCVKGQLFLLNCPSGFRFDSEADQCVRKIHKDEIEQSKSYIFQ
jgi:hypothetical protein